MNQSPKVDTAVPGDEDALFNAEKKYLLFLKFFVTFCEEQGLQIFKRLYLPPNKVKAQKSGTVYELIENQYTITKNFFKRRERLKNREDTYVQFFTKFSPYYLEYVTFWEWAQQVITHYTETDEEFNEKMKLADSYFQEKKFNLKELINSLVKLTNKKKCNLFMKNDNIFELVFKIPLLRIQTYFEFLNVNYLQDLNPLSETIKLLDATQTRFEKFLNLSQKFPENSVIHKVQTIFLIFYYFFFSK